MSGESFPDLNAILDNVAKNVSGEFNCSISISFKNSSGTASMAAGTTDFSTGRQASPTDRYAFGSITKMLTGSSILKLISEGKFGLDDPVAPLVDPFLSGISNFTMEELWGADNVKNETIRTLLSMTGGVPDFDTANPCYTPGCFQGDSLRAALYNEPSRGYDPVELMSVDWVKGAEHWIDCEPVAWNAWTPFCYSSTNYMLLGMLLAADAQASGWEDFDQSEYLSQYLANQISYAKHGTPEANGVVHGYDRTKYNMFNGTLNNHDNFEVAGVFSGWSASDVVATTSAVAELTWDIHAAHKVAPKEYADMMIPKEGRIYGMAAHNIASYIGQTGEYGVAYGHLGATYGYQSVTAYFPKLDFVLTVASNIETDSQTQPALALCFAYNEIAGMMLGQEIVCKRSQGDYFGNVCTCTPIKNDVIV